MFSTQVLPQLESSDDSEEENNSEIVGLIVVGDKEFEVKRGETKIGRDSSLCSIVLEDFTVSKIHAIIESEGVDDTFIYDVGSTNQTKLKKKVLKPHCRYKLDNESKLIFGNVTAKFILPPDKSSSLSIKPDRPDLVNFNSVEELEDIFDVATQVDAQSNSTSEAFVFEKHERNSSVFKNPNSVLSANMGKSFESLRNCFDKVTQCRLNCEEETLKTVPHNSAFGKSDIFSLKTQCQLYETSITEKIKFEAKTIPCHDSHNDCESDKIKILLNDGEDDVLCTFMSLHSPDGKSNDNSLVEVKVKSEIINLSQVLDAPTQVQTEINQEFSANDETEIANLKEKNRNLSIDFSSRSSSKPSVTSTPLNKRSKIGDSNGTCENSDRFTEHMKEDFIITQEFKVDSLNSGKKYKCASHDLDCLSQDEIQFHLEETSDNFTAKEQKNFNEDLILSRSFEVFEKTHQNKETKKLFPENYDLSEVDFTGTQISDFEKEKQKAEEKTIEKRSSYSPGNCNSDAESHSDKTLDFSQRNSQNDFISTQIFEGITNIRKENDNSNKDDNSNDEDFISTQPAELSLIKSMNSRSLHEGTGNVKTFCKESSPDLLGLEDTWNNLEDSIATQKFEMPECQNLKKNCAEITLQTNSGISALSETEKFDCNIELTKVPQIVDSSGDETESDLEILFNSSEKGKSRQFLECVSKSFKAEPELENTTQLDKAIIPESNCNSSYVFELNPENRLEDDAIRTELRRLLRAEGSNSDATDCEELVVICQKKKDDLPCKIEMEKNRMTSTLSHDLDETPCSNDGLMTDKKTHKFENRREMSPLSPLSLEMPSTQDVETTISNFLRNKSEEKKDCRSPLKINHTEVGNKNLDQSISIKQIDLSEKPIDAVLKRPLDSNIADMVPLKKLKNEITDGFFESSDKQFSKLVKSHDIAQIQPCRTRNSMRALITGNILNNTDVSLGNSITNERPTSRRKGNGKRKSIRKSNGDITPYLTTKRVESRRSYYADRKRETSLRENNMELKPNEGSNRILRSSKRNSGISVSSLSIESPTRIRRSKRCSRTKSWEYYNNPCVNIVFTGFECESLDKIIGVLGGKKTNDISFCEVVVADKVRRTVKFLCAIGLCLPITSPQWLMSCKKKKKFLNPWDFILKDEESERKWDFELRTSLERSRKMNLLQGYNVFATENTKPPQKDMLAIVESCGGTPLSIRPDVWPKNTIVVTCLEDKQRWPLAKFKNVKVVHYEFILSGVLKQKLDFKTYKLQ